MPWANKCSPSLPASIHAGGLHDQFEGRSEVHSCGWQLGDASEYFKRAHPFAPPAEKQDADGRAVCM
jgi:hypothetical protein